MTNDNNKTFRLNDRQRITNYYYLRDNNNVDDHDHQREKEEEIQIIQ